MDKGILTLAIGRKYNKQAKYLAYSCILHSPWLPRAIITDDCEYFSRLYDITIQYTEDMGDPFSVKLKLHRYSPFGETLFLDADTLVYTDLRFMWDYFGNQSVVYNGSCEKKGNWYFKEISDILIKYNIPWVGKLNSGVFLFKKDVQAVTAFDYAIDLHKNHNDGEVPFFRKKMLPDEPFLAIAFGKYNQLPKEQDYGRLGRSLIHAKVIKLDITKGISSLIKRGSLVFPAVVHFTGTAASGHTDFYYSAEKIRLLFLYKNIPGSLIFSIIIRMSGAVFGPCLRIAKRFLKRLLRNNRQKSF